MSPAPTSDLSATLPSADAPACRPQALSPAERTAQQSLLRKFRGSLVGREDGPDRLEVRVDLSRMSLPELGAWLDLERRCCPFLTVGLRLEARAKEARLSFGEGPDAAAAARMELLGG